MASFGRRHRRARSSLREQAWLAVRRGLCARAGVVALVGLLALGASACATGRQTGTGAGTPTISASAVPGTPTTVAGGYPVKVYFSKHPDSDNDPAKVYMAERVSPTLGVATYAIQQLIAGPTAGEQSAGLYTPLTISLSGASTCGGADFTLTLNMRGSKPQPGTATLKLCHATSLAGDLTGGRIAAEIDATLLQFSNIKQVAILTQSGSCFNDFKGANDCLK
ncbi:MAG TPA: hypothetical protein VKQ30_09130 [Ktedonobacterales bacterium]|nr:hypothetical protein [Ktedonobacterales bacterium]